MATSDYNLTHSITAAHQGSQEAVGEALEACRAYLLMVAQTEMDPTLQAKGGASDLVQETFLEAQRDFGSFRGSTEAELLAWLRQVLLNNLSNFARRYRGTAKRDVRREVRLEVGVSSLDWRDELSGAAATPSQHAVVRETNESLEEALARLPADYQRVILLRYRRDLAFEEIARMMNRSSNAVRKLWARAVEQLQREMES